MVIFKVRCLNTRILLILSSQQLHKNSQIIHCVIEDILDDQPQSTHYHGAYMQNNITHQKATGNSIAYFYTYGAVFIALGLASAALGPMLPYLADHIKVSLSQISFSFTAINLGYMLGSTGGGRLLDRFRGHVLMILAMLLSVIMFFMIPITLKLLPLMVILFLLGLGQGMLDVGSNTNILWVYQAQAGPSMNALHFFFGAGAFLSPIVLHLILNWTGGQLTWPFWSLAFLTVPGIIGLWILPSPENPEKDHVTSTEDRSNKAVLGLLIFLFFLYVGIEIGFGGWIFTYVIENEIASETSASLITSVFWGALTLGRLLSIRLSKKILPSNLLIGNFGLALLCLGSILVFPMSPRVVWLSSAGMGLAFSTVFPTLMVLGESRLRISGTVTGLFFFGASLGGTLIPMILGQVFEFIGTYQVIVSLFMLTILGLGVLLFLNVASRKLGEKVRT